MTSSPRPAPANPGGQWDSKGAPLNYMNDLLQFRIEMANNLADHSNPLQSIYVVDTNVARMFLTSKGEAPNVNPFPSGKRDYSEDFWRATVGITAEYIFSRSLPGQKGYPVYIEQGHAQELLGYRHALFADAEKYQSHKFLRSLEADLSSAVSSSLKDIQDNRDKPEILRQILESDVPELITRFELDNLAAAMQLDRLTREELIRPLSLSTYMNQKLLNPPDEDVEEWIDVLSAYNSSRAGRRTPKALKTDARCLAIIFALNEYCLSNNIPARYLFVTTDHKIPAAVALYLDRKNLPFEKDFVRRFSQFVPILNFQDMPNFVSRSQVTFELIRAVDSLLAFPSQNRGDKYTMTLYRDALSVRQHIEDFEMIKRKLEERDAPRLKRLEAAWRRWTDENLAHLVRPSVGADVSQAYRLWVEMARNAVGLNVELLLQHNGARLAQIKFLISSLASLGTDRDAIGSAFVRYQEGLLRQLDRNHMEWLAISFLSGGDIAQDDRPRRAPYTFLFCRPDEALEVNYVDTLLESETKAGAARLSALFGNDSVPYHWRALLTAHMAYRLNQWDAATEHSLRALDVIPKPQGGIGGEAAANPGPDYIYYIEALFFNAVCRRFQANALYGAMDQDRLDDRAAGDSGAMHAIECMAAQLHEVLEKAEKTHEEILEHETNTLIRARSLSELATLLLTKFLIIQLSGRKISFLQDRAGETEDEEEFFYKAMVNLQEAFSLLPHASPPARYAQQYEMVRTAVRTQCCANLLSGTLMLNVFGLERGYLDWPIIDMAVSELSDPAQGHHKILPPHVLLEIELYHWFQKRYADNMVPPCGDLLGKIDALLKEHLSSGEVITALDAEMLKYYARAVAEKD
ncbi:MAG: hypothetical protein EP335_03745 [Alphaproteobacteria bacterium]|nr:MAG: hypothetical protein EP335_03745 [Alphaproteobacteria bacterium]